MFITHDEGKELVARPMSTQHVDDNGDLWFMSRKDSNKNRQIENGSHVHLFYGSISNSHYLAVK